MKRNMNGYYVCVPLFVCLVLAIELVLAADFKPTDKILLSCGGPAVSTDPDGREWTTDNGSKFGSSTGKSNPAQAATQDPAVHNLLGVMVVKIFRLRDLGIIGNQELDCRDQDYVPEDIGSISGFEPPQSPTSSYDNSQHSSEDYAKEPPLVPPHFATTLLNLRTTNMKIQPPMPRPQHGVLNHLFMQKEKSSNSVVALGTTHRYLAKYVIVVLYKSLQR